jgi:hypothetical protein
MNENEYLMGLLEGSRDMEGPFWHETLTVGHFEEVDFHALVFETCMATVGLKNDKYVVLVAVSEDHRTGRSMKPVSQLAYNARGMGISSAGYEIETRNVVQNLAIRTSCIRVPVITIPKIFAHTPEDVYYESRILLAGHDVRLLATKFHFVGTSCRFDPYRRVVSIY